MAAATVASRAMPPRNATTDSNAVTSKRMPSIVLTPSPSVFTLRRGAKPFRETLHGRPASSGSRGGDRRPGAATRRAARPSGRHAKLFRPGGLVRLAFRDRPLRPEHLLAPCLLLGDVAEQDGGGDGREQGDAAQERDHGLEDHHVVVDSFHRTHLLSIWLHSMAGRETFPCNLSQRAAPFFNPARGGILHLDGPRGRPRREPLIAISPGDTQCHSFSGWAPTPSPSSSSLTCCRASWRPTASWRRWGPPSSSAFST